MTESEMTSIVVTLLTVVRDVETVDQLNALVDTVTLEDLASMVALSTKRAPTLEGLEFAEQAWIGIVGREGERLMGVTQPRGYWAA